MHGFIHGDIPSVLAGSGGSSTDGERLLVSAASEAVIEPGNVQCGPRWRVRNERVDRRWSDTQAGVRDPRPLARGFLQVDSRNNFGVDDSCHLVGSERNIAAVWGGLAGNEVRRFPAQADGPREGSGPIGAPDSGDDVWIRHGPSPRAAGPIKVGAVQWCSLGFCSEYTVKIPESLPAFGTSVPERHPISTTALTHTLHASTHN